MGFDLVAKIKAAGDGVSKGVQKVGAGLHAANEAFGKFIKVRETLTKFNSDQSAKFTMDEAEYKKMKAAGIAALYVPGPGEPDLKQANNYALAAAKLYFNVFVQVGADLATPKPAPVPPKAIGK